MQFKGGRMRTANFEMPGMGATYMLIDLNSAVMRTVAPAKRGYYESSLRSTSTGEEEEQPLEITPLGRTQLISGVRCTGYRVTQGDQVSHVWTTDDPAFRQLVTGWFNLAGEDDAGVRQARAIIARYGAPVMTQEFDDEGGYRIEVWTLERKPLPDSLFVVPAGFTKLRSPGN
jgi:hypothetical protein